MNKDVGIIGLLVLACMVSLILEDFDTVELDMKLKSLLQVTSGVGSFILGIMIKFNKA